MQGTVVLRIEAVHFWTCGGPKRLKKLNDEIAYMLVARWHNFTAFMPLGFYAHTNPKGDDGKDRGQRQQ